jgi:hypothetical protein
LSRPVVCTNFQGLETNTFIPASGVDQGHSTSGIALLRKLESTVYLATKKFSTQLQACRRITSWYLK